MRRWILTDPLRDAKAIFRQLYPPPDSFDSDGEVEAPEPLSADEGAGLMRELKYKMEVMDERGCAEFLDWAEEYLQQDSRYMETEFLRPLQALMN